MPDGSEFRELCESVRFVLDEPTEGSQGARMRVSDYVARVRSLGLRATPRLTPTLSRCIERVSEALQLDQSPEVYVVNEPSANALAPMFGIAERPVIVINSGLITLLTPTELEFAIGHELGHLGLNHSRDDAEETEFEALQARSRQRAAEISSDRVGLLAVRSVYTASHVMVKIASGLTGAAVGLDIDQFIAQIEREPDEVSREWELHQSHPSLPLRLWALLRFAKTSEYCGLSGTGSGVEALSTVDGEIARRLADLGDGRLSAMEEDVFRRVVLWLSVRLVCADDVVTDQEHSALAKLVGSEPASKGVAFATAHGTEAVDAKLREALRGVAAGSPLVRRRLITTFEEFATALGESADRTAPWPAVKAAVGPALRFR